jgi:hypothetical protein
VGKQPLWNERPVGRTEAGETREHCGSREHLHRGEFGFVLPKIDSIAAGGLGSADACACWCPGALSAGSGIVRDQLSLAVAIVSIDSRVAAKVAFCRQNDHLARCERLSSNKCNALFLNANCTPGPGDT